MEILCKIATVRVTVYKFTNVHFNILCMIVGYVYNHVIQLVHVFNYVNCHYAAALGVAMMVFVAASMTNTSHADVSVL